MNSAKIIKLPSHCSSPSFALQCIKKNVKTECCKWWFQVSVSLWFSFRFYILTCIIIQEPRKAANIPGFEKTKTMVVLRYLFTVSSAFVRFASFSLPFALSLFFQSLLFSFVLLPRYSPHWFENSSIIAANVSFHYRHRFTAVWRQWMVETAPLGFFWFGHW
jgi:hypothetical protein